MSQNANDVLTDALTLSPADRSKLAASLIESLDEFPDDEVVGAWEQEIQGRLQDIDSGSATLISWAEARRLIRGDAGDVSQR
ncbi:MAG: addiction module protein [Planctomyces sp.]|nr:addiction module protein [Planctomyces sp.]